jgi:hypothetical protein
MAPNISIKLPNLACIEVKKMKIKLHLPLKYTDKELIVHDNFLLDSFLNIVCTNLDWKVTIFVAINLVAWIVIELIVYHLKYWSWSLFHKHSHFYNNEKL